MCGTREPECFQRWEGATDDGCDGWERLWMAAQTDKCEGVCGTQVPEYFQRREGATDDGYDGCNARNGSVVISPVKGPGAR